MLKENTFDMKNALILAGGGVAGIAWELGVLRGLQDTDPGLAARVLAADLVVGTSAGSAVAAQITSGVPLDDLYGRQLSETSAEIEVQLDMEQLLARFTAAVSATASQDEALRAIGALALDSRDRGRAGAHGRGRRPAAGAGLAGPAHAAARGRRAHR